MGTKNKDFDKNKYWENRKAGKPGIDPEPSRVVKYYTPKEWQEQKDKERMRLGELEVE